MTDKTLDEYSLFARMEIGYYAEMEAEERISEILGVELLGISWDWYDTSFEIFPLAADDVAVTQEQHEAIMALGCSRYWINFRNGDERSGRGERRQASHNRWEGFNRGAEIRRAKRQEPAAVLIGVVE